MTDAKCQPRHSHSYLIFKISMAIIVLGGGFLGWYHWVDGVYMNRVLEFKEGVDPMNLKLTKREFKTGETPQFQTSFCKNRDALSITRWTLVNEHPHYENVKERVVEIPTGCYPLNGEKYQIADTKPIDPATPPGEYHYVATTNHILPDGRVRKQYYETEIFHVVP